jgi:hypothetical protein
MQPVTWQPATGNWQLATGNRQPATFDTIDEVVRPRFEALQ